MQSYSVEQPKKKGFFKKLFSEPEQTQKKPEEVRKELYQDESYRKGTKLEDENRM